MPDPIRSGGSESVAMTRQVVVLNAIETPWSRRASTSMGTLAVTPTMKNATASKTSEPASSARRLNASMAGAENTLNTSAVMANELMTNPTSAEVAPSASASSDTSTFTIWMTSHMMPFTMNRLMNDLLQMPALPIATPLPRVFRFVS